MSVKTNFQMCCVCLGSDRKSYKMEENDLYKYYTDLTDRNLTIDDAPSKIICWECSARLMAAVRFKTNALLSQTVMRQFLNFRRHNEVTLDTSLIDTHKKKLKSNLIEKIFEPNHANYHFIYSEPILTNNTHTVDILMVKIETDTMNEKNAYSDDEAIKEEECFYEEKEDREEKGYIENNSIQINKNSLLEVNESDTSSDEILINVKDKKVKRVPKIKKVEKIDRRKKPANEVLNTEIFNIMELSYEEQMNDIKKRKNSTNYTNSGLKCDKCFKGFVDEDAYKSHMNRHTVQGGPYKCNICEIRFKNTRALGNHVSSHMQKFCCKKCSYVTTRRHAAKMHEEYHNGTKYQCPHCFDEFSKKTTYMSHVRVKHPTDIVCEICGYWFVSSKGLVQHKKIKHRFDDHPVPPDGPECTECNVKFVNKEALDRHMKVSPKHAVTIDGRRVPSRIYSERKKKIPKIVNTKRVKSESPMQCEQCDMQLPDSLSYYRHFRRTHPDKNRTNYPTLKGQSMCEVCGKMFQSLALLQDHSTTHTEGKQFACPLCGKRFQRKYRLIAHRSLHVRRSRHACALCTSVFTTASNLNRHMASHSGHKPHKCEICDKSFKLASEKRSHINYVHLKEPWPKKAKGKRKVNKQNQLQSEDVTESAETHWMSDSQHKIAPTLLENKSIYYNE